MDKSFAKNLILVITVFFIFTQTMIIFAQETSEYVVQKGDTLWSIAGKTLGKPELWQQIWKANEQTIKDPALIQPGDKLIIPSSQTQAVAPVEEKKEEVPALQISEEKTTEVTEKKEETSAQEAVKEEVSTPEAEEEMPVEETAAPAETKEEVEEKPAELFKVAGVKDTKKVEIISNILVGNLKNEPPLERETIPLSKFSYDGKITKPVTKTNEITKVLLATDDEVIINVGRNKNLEEGMVLSVYKKGRLLKERAELEKGEGSERNVVNRIAELKIIEVQKNSAIGKLTRCLEPVGVGDLVKIK